MLITSCRSPRRGCPAPRRGIPLRRLDFANDLRHGALVAVAATVNRSKADRDPAEWVPPNESAWCGYAAAWVRTKVRWDLSADPLEFTALATMLDGCP